MEFLPLLVISLYVILIISTVIFYGVGLTWNFFSPPFVNVQNSITNTIQNSFQSFVVSTQNTILEAIVGIVVVIGLAEIINAFEKPNRWMGIAGIVSLFLIPAMWITLKWVNTAYILTFFAQNAQFLSLFDSVWFITAIEILLAVATILNFRHDKKQDVIYSEHPA